MRPQAVVGGVEVGPLVPQASGPPCDCAAGQCRFRPRVVYVYLLAAVEARRAGEPLALVIRAELRNAREIDPWSRGGRADPDASLDIALSLERARDVGGIGLVPANADRVSRFLCPFRHDERANGSR